MSLESKLEKLKGRAPGLILQENCRRSAVLIPLIKNGSGCGAASGREDLSEYSLLFEVRAAKIGRQPGDCCFPGGGIKRGETAEDAAVRETCEELLVEPDSIELLFESDVFYNTDTVVYPFAAYLKDYDGSFSADEVAEVFTIPLSFFLESKPVLYQSEIIRVPEEDFPFDLIAGGRDYKWPSRKDKELFYLYEGHTIWGITARIIKGFIELLK